MKNTVLLLTIAATLATTGCSMWPWGHKQPKSSFKIIEDGDRNPYIIDAPARAGTVKAKPKVTVETSPVNPQ